jgi:hypothetical protein
LVLCITTFRGAIAESLADKGAFLHCIAQLIQLFIRSFYGQQLLDPSSKIAEAIYDSGCTMGRKNKKSDKNRLSVLIALKCA